MNEGNMSGVSGMRGWPAVLRRRSSRVTACSQRTSVRGCTSATSRRRIGRADPGGQEQGLERHRRGHPAPPAADRRPGRDLRPDLQGQPAAAYRRRRRAAPRGTRRRHDRLRRHRPCPASHRGQGVRVGGGRDGHARTRDRPDVVQHTMVDTGLLDWAGVADRMS
jgi:dihydroorotase